jgi:hypothetical protein
MDRARLMEVLNNSTCLISKGDITQKKLPGISILLWSLLLSHQDPEASQFEQVDCHYITVGVNKRQAEQDRAVFLEFLESYPDPQKLSEGPSYKHVAEVVGDEMTALRVFGMGQALGLWEVLLPDQFDVPPELVDEAVDLGLIVTTGYRAEQRVELQLAVG